MATSQILSGRAAAMWRRCLSSAFRTAFACSIVGGVTLYGPESIAREIAFPSFSYATVILIVTDATLGDTIRGCWLAFYGTVLGVCPAVLSLWLIGPAKLNTVTTAAVVGVSAFVVALPENTHLISKRIALGQIVLVYVIAFIKGAETEAIMHPVRVVASTAIGVVACVLALLFPFPGLAFLEVKKNFKLYMGNASERLKLFVKAVSAEDDKFRNGLISRTNFLNITARKLLSNIESKQISLKWEPTMLLKSFNKNPGVEKMRNLETVLNGMEISLTNCTEFPVKILGSELKNDVAFMEDKFLNQVKNLAVEKTTLALPDMVGDSKLLQALQTSALPFTSKDLPSLFFIFCLKLIHFKPAQPIAPYVSSKQGLTESEEKKGTFFTKMKGKNVIIVSKRRLMQALRCSFSLGFSVLFGLIYSRDDGYWAGLTVAISHAAAREATFRVSNIKCQGTVLGTVYGLMGCFLFNYAKIRYLSLIPWFIFSSFLRTSRMYGHAGAISAVIGAVLILGRNNFGSPSEFAIARIVETFIGLSCSVIVDMMLQPTRAAVLAKVQLSESLKMLHESVGSISLRSTKSKSSVEEVQKRLKIQVNELGKFIEEAEVEPNFWFLPFHIGCYMKVKGSLSKMVDFFLFESYAIEIIKQESRKVDSKILKEVGAKLEADFKLLQHAICSRLKDLEEVCLVKSLTKLENDYEKRKSSLDLELGKSSISEIQWPTFDDNEMKRSTNSFLQHLDEIKNMEVDKDGEKIIKKEIILSLGAFFFCMNGVLKRTVEIEMGIKELVQWENPSSQVDLHAILSKIHAVGQSQGKKHF